MINNSHLSDVIFKLKDGQEMVAHSFMLSLRSQVLAQVHVEFIFLAEKPPLVNSFSFSFTSSSLLSLLIGKKCKSKIYNYYKINDSGTTVWYKY